MLNVNSFPAFIGQCKPPYVQPLLFFSLTGFQNLLPLISTIISNSVMLTWAIKLILNRCVLPRVTLTHGLLHGTCTAIGSKK